MHKILSAVMVGAVSVLLSACGTSTIAEPAPAPVRAIVEPVSLKPAGCTKAAPTSAKGYARMFASVDTREWGAADVSISVPMSNGRVVWLYGDTFSEGRFVHSTMIVQDKGCLHVSNGGAQLIPNVNSRHIFWIESGKALDSKHIRVYARAVTLTDPANPWGFKDGGYTKTFTVTLNSKGDAVKVVKGKTLVRPAQAVGDFIKIDSNPHHFGYAKAVHPWAKMKSGKTLTTICQNWDDGVLHPFKDYRPIFSEH